MPLNFLEIIFLSLKCLNLALKHITSINQSINSTFFHSRFRCVDRVLFRSIFMIPWSLIFLVVIHFRYVTFIVRIRSLGRNNCFVMFNVDTVIIRKTRNKFTVTSGDLSFISLAFSKAQKRQTTFWKWQD